MNFLLRVFSFVFLVPLTLFFLAVSGFSMMQGMAINLEFLPWTGDSLTTWVFLISLAGMLSILLALRKKARVLYAIYAIAFLGLALNGVFRSGYRFDGPTDFYWAVAFCGAALIAAAGAIIHARR